MTRTNLALIYLIQMLLSILLIFKALHLTGAPAITLLALAITGLAYPIIRMSRTA